MDVLNFDPAAVSGDATTEVEGYDDHIEQIEQAYPEEDFRTPAEIEEENEVQRDGEVTPVAHEYDPNATGTTPDTEVTPTEVVGASTQLSDEEFWRKPEIDLPGPLGNWELYNPHLKNALQNADQYGYMPSELLRDHEGKLIDDGIRRTNNLNWTYLEKEHKSWETYEKNGGDANLENQLWMINQIRNDPEMLIRHDRNGDGQFTISDWHNVGTLSPEDDARLTEAWLKSLEDKNITRRGKEFFRQFAADGFGLRLPFGIEIGKLDTNMARYTNTRRLQAIGPDHLMKEDGESTRQAALGSLWDLGKDLASVPEKAFAAITQSEFATGEESNDWFNEEVFVKHDAKTDDFLFREDDPLSLGYQINHPVNRVWSDAVTYDVMYYGVPIAAMAVATKGASLTLGAGTLGATSLAGKTGAVLATTTAATAIETAPLALIRDTTHKGMGNFYNENTMMKRYADAHPEAYIFGMQMSEFLETPQGRQFSHMGDEVVYDAATQGALFGAFRGLRRGLPSVARRATRYIENFNTSTKPWSSNVKTNLRNGQHWLQVRKQQLADKIEAGRSQQRMAEEGPASPWVEDPWTPASTSSTYGSYKNGPNQAGQSVAKPRGSVLDINNQLDEIDGQVGIEGGATDALFTPLEQAQFSKSGVPDPWISGKFDEYWNSPNLKAQLDSLNPLQRTMGEYSNSTLRRTQEILGRDASSVSPREFWGDAFVDTPIKPGEVLDDIKKFVVKNLQVQDAVNMTLLKQLRDTANAAGEQIGKNDLFAVDGPVRRIANNLVTGLSEVKKTQFTWELAQKRIRESGEELTPNMVREIEEIVGKRAPQIQKETGDGVKLMMQMLEGADDDQLLEGVLDVFKVSNDIHNWKDFDAWMRQKIKGGEFNGQVKTGALIHELQGVMVNSILSGPKTPLRAILGTTTNSYLNALNEAAGATIRRPFTGDVASHKASMAKLKGMVELIPEAFEVFRQNFKAKWSADLADIRTRYSEAPTGHDQNWELFGKWTERNGTASDKAAFYIANIARNLNNNKILSWSPRALAATDDTFKWLLARARSKEIGMRQALEVAGRDHVDFSADLMKQAEDIHMKNLLDADGNLDISQDAWLTKQFKEVTLTSELTGFSQKLDGLFNSTPLMKPFYLFARTGVNGLNLAFKNTPILGALHKESLAILQHTGDDFTPLFKYGIENADDLANARNLFAGRQAVGAGVVMGMGGMYAAGQLTGNGPADRQLKQQWLNAGWKPNHVYIGDVGFDYTSLEPYNTIFSSIADIGDNMELMGSEWAEKRLQAVAFVLGRGLTSKTYMSGLDQLMQVVQMKPGALSKTGANILNNSIPLAGLRNEFGKWVNPHMNELNGSMWDSIRNRNKASELIALEPLPQKSDLLNGKPINNWNIVGRSFNAVSPIQLDIRNSSPGRKLLLDSNYDLKTTTYAYGGYSFVQDAHVRAHFQNAIGTVPITVGFKKFKNVEEALNHLATRSDVKTSMAKMKANGKNPALWDVDPNDYPHNTLIDNVMNQARAKAWAKINNPNHPGYTRLEKLKEEKDGQSSRTRDTRSEILELNYPSRQVEQFPKN